MNRLICLLLLVLSALSRAHDALPNAHWCEGPRQHAVLVSTLTLTPNQIRDYLRELEANTLARTGQICGRGVSLRDCGDHPDDWTAALGLAGNGCAAMQTGRIVPGNDLNTVIPIVTHPAHFYTGLSTQNGLNTHHQDYSAAQGLAASCMRCEATPAQTIPPR